MTLYISDLDGTLLDRNASLPYGASELLQLLDSHGVAVTYATARTIKSVGHILSDAPKKYPAALMNGVLVCELDKEKYLSAAYFRSEDFLLVQKVLGDSDIDPFTYYLNGDELSTAYEKISNKVAADSDFFVFLHRCYQYLSYEETNSYICCNVNCDIFSSSTR
jgi:hydroxymethylpyrimidine pyrophosphatase-like HAD family hydrolase